MFVCVVWCISVCKGLTECMRCGVCVFVCGFVCSGGYRCVLLWVWRVAEGAGVNTKEFG